MSSNEPRDPPATELAADIAEATAPIVLLPDFSSLDEAVIPTCNTEDVEYCDACQ